MSDDQTYLFCDLETTGLDPARAHILEAAFVLTHGPETGFKEIGSVEALVGLPDNPAWDRRALEMHQGTGLLADYDDAEAAGHLHSLDALAAELVWLLGNANADDYSRPLFAARNPAFDKGFVEAHLPEIADRLHYRCFDITTICAVDPSLYDAVDGFEFDGVPHRAEFDIRRDLEMARVFVRRYSGGPASGGIEANEDSAPDVIGEIVEEAHEFADRPKAGMIAAPDGDCLA